MISKEELEILNKYGWTVDCESPLELSRDDGSIATRTGAEHIIAYLLDEDLINKSLAAYEQEMINPDYPYYEEGFEEEEDNDW